MTSGTHTVGVIETRGIEPVPDSERTGSAADLFWTWFAANIGVLGITLGAALVAVLGLNVPQAVLVAAVGSAGSFLLVGMLSTAGRTGGAPGLTLSRAVFGVRGNRAPTLVSWLGFVGWETVMCVTATFALLAVLAEAGVAASPAVTVCCLLFCVGVAGGIGVFGHATIMWIQKWLSWIFGGLTVVVVGFLCATVDWAAALAQPAAPLSAVMAGIGLIAAGTGLGWLSAGPDYTRYLPRRTSSARIVGATVVGASIPLIGLISTGALMATGDPGLAAANDPVAAIGAALPASMLVPYLLTAVFGLIAAADLSMYSSGLNLITGGIPVRRTSAVLVDAALIVGGGLYVTVIAQDFYGPFTTFLTLLAVPLTAWAGVFGIDLAHRTGYDPAGLIDTSATGPYWYTGGVRWPTLGAWLVATVLGLLFTQVVVDGSVWFAGPLSGTWLGENSLGWLVAGGAAALLALPAVRPGRLGRGAAEKLR